jgi:hypothetical protein
MLNELLWKARFAAAVEDQSRREVKVELARPGGRAVRPYTNIEEE